jgi:hypothetical protein
MDFFNPLLVASSPYQQLANAQWQQMPFFYVSLSWLKFIPHNIAFCLILGLFITVLATIYFFAFHIDNYWKSIISTIILLSCYPIVFSIDRGNLEMLFFLFLLVTLILFKKHHYNHSAIVLAVAVAFKPFAIALLPLFLYKKRYLECIFIPLAAILITIISLLILPGSLWSNFHSWMTNMRLYNTNYVLSIEGMIGGNSIFGALKLWFITAYYPYSINNTQTWMQTMAPTYLYGTILLAALVSYFIIRFQFDFWKKVTLLICCMNLLPTVSGDYRLIHFLIPLYFWLQTIPKEKHSLVRQSHFKNKDYVYQLFFALLLIPRNYYHFWGRELTTAIYTSPAIMLLFMFFIIIDYYVENRHGNRLSDISCSQIPSYPSSIQS